MTAEEKLKDLILKRYHSVREFTIAIDIPYTTMASIFKRGIDNSSISSITKICKALGISVDALADGEIRVAKARPEILPDETLDIEDIMSNAKDELIHHRNITLNGSPISKAGLESIIDAMEVGIEIAKKKSQQKQSF
jgi:predicted transcriptional regulator